MKPCQNQLVQTNSFYSFRDFSKPFVCSLGLNDFLALPLTFSRYFPLLISNRILSADRITATNPVYLTSGRNAPLKPRRPGGVVHPRRYAAGGEGRRLPRLYQTFGRLPVPVHHRRRVHRFVCDTALSPRLRVRHIFRRVANGAKKTIINRKVEKNRRDVFRAVRARPLLR